MNPPIWWGSSSPRAVLRRSSPDLRRWPNARSAPPHFDEPIRLRQASPKTSCVRRQINCYGLGLFRREFSAHQLIDVKPRLHGGSSVCVGGIDLGLDMAAQIVVLEQEAVLQGMSSVRSRPGSGDGRARPGCASCRDHRAIPPDRPDAVRGGISAPRTAGYRP